jgi:hypothetical protein
MQELNEAAVAAVATGCGISDALVKETQDFDNLKGSLMAANVSVPTAGQTSASPSSAAALNVAQVVLDLYEAKDIEEHSAPNCEGGEQPNELTAGRTVSKKGTARKNAGKRTRRAKEGDMNPSSSKGRAVEQRANEKPGLETDLSFHLPIRVSKRLQKMQENYLGIE